MTRGTFGKDRLKPKDDSYDVLAIRAQLKPKQEEATRLRVTARLNMKNNTPDPVLLARLRLLEEECRVMLSNIARLKRG